MVVESLLAPSALLFFMQHQITSPLKKLRSSSEGLVIAFFKPTSRIKMFYAQVIILMKKMWEAKKSSQSLLKREKSSLLKHLKRKALSFRV